MGLISSVFSSRTPPIGVDLGSHVLRMAQVEVGTDGTRANRAASVAVPQELWSKPDERIEFFAEAARKLISDGEFEGRRVVLGLPAACMDIQRLRLPSLDEAATRQAIHFELAGRLPFRVSDAVIRFLRAGEVYEQNEARDEIIVIAARRKLTEQLLAAAGRAKLQVAGFHPEPVAVARCFSGEEGGSKVFIDVGGSATRMYVAHADRVMFARSIPMGMNDLAKAAGQSKLDAPPSETAAVGEKDSAGSEPLDRLIRDLALSMRYYASTFPGMPVSRGLFIGGGAGDRGLCQRIAIGLQLRARIAAPIAAEHIVGSTELEESPAAWSVAVGLSLIDEAVAAAAA